MKLETRLEEQVVQIELQRIGSQDAPRFSLTVGRKDSSENIEVDVLSQTGQRWTLMRDNEILDLLVWREDDRVLVEWENRIYEIEIYDPRDRLLLEGADSSHSIPAVIKAQMPGKVVRVLKKAGDPIQKGEGIVVIEAMKMQNEIKSPRNGTVVDCPLEEGTGVSAGQILAEID